jgi:hypothetical protein
LLGGLKVETTHVGKKLPKNNNMMQEELGDVVVIAGNVILEAYVEE